MVSKIALYKKNKANLQDLTPSSVAESQSSPTDERLSWIFENVNETNDSWDSIFALIQNQKETTDHALTLEEMFERIKSQKEL